MKRSLKITFAALALCVGSVALSSCTASFCTVTDKAHILYLFDYGVTKYYSSTDENKPADATVLTVKVNSTEYTINNVYKYSTFGETDEEEKFTPTNKYLWKIYEAALTNGVAVPTINYFAAFDQIVLENAIAKEIELGMISTDKISGLSADDIICPVSKYGKDGTEYVNNKGILDRQGYLKFDDTTGANKKAKLWANWNEIHSATKKRMGVEKIDEVANRDFVKLYQQKMNQNIQSYRSCLAVTTGDYGAYGPYSLPAEIQGKKWTDWKGLLEFILVWPIGAFIDVLCNAFSGLPSGVPQILAILIVTVIIRSLMLIVTFKQQKSTAVMSELQPELAKIQAKYPNANTSQVEKQRMAEETARLYKKNKINPFTSLLVMIIQFPVFICVWGAMQGSSALSSGALLGLKFSDSINSVLFSASGWKSGAAVTALVLFILMAAAQVVSMLLPQWYQKKRQKQVAKLGKNPAQQSQDKKMKYFTYGMMIMIIIMGFTLASGLGVYWFVGALFSIAQTIITQKVTAKKKGIK